MNYTEVPVTGDYLQAQAFGMLDQVNSHIENLLEESGDVVYPIYVLWDYGFIDVINMKG